MLIREPSSAECSKTMSVPTPSKGTVERLRREVERAARPGPGGRGDEVLVDDHCRRVSVSSYLNGRLERVRRARDAERARDLLERQRRLDEDQRASAPRSRRVCSGLAVDLDRVAGRELGRACRRSARARVERPRDGALAIVVRRPRVVRSRNPSCSRPAVGPSSSSPGLQRSADRPRLDLATRRARPCRRGGSRRARSLCPAVVTWSSRSPSRRRSPQRARATSSKAGSARHGQRVARRRGSRTTGAEPPAQLRVVEQRRRARAAAPSPPRGPGRGRSSPTARARRRGGRSARTRARARRARPDRPSARDRGRRRARGASGSTDSACQLEQRDEASASSLRSRRRPR